MNVKKIAENDPTSLLLLAIAENQTRIDLERMETEGPIMVRHFRKIAHKDKNEIKPVRTTSLKMLW